VLGKTPIVYAKAHNRGLNRMINRERNLIMFVDVKFGRGYLIGILEEHPIDC